MKTHIILFFILLSSFKGVASDFITVWDLNLQQDLTIRFKATCTVPTNYRWESIPVGFSGAGKIEDTITTITFPAKGRYRLLIPSEWLTYFSRPNSQNEIYSPFPALVDVEAWGNAQWKSFALSFMNCRNLIITATDIPDLSKVEDLSAMFRQCTKLNGPNNIGSWNISNVKTMNQMFYGATSFNQPIGSWNTSNTNSMELMFAVATNFNQPIGNWNTSNVYNMRQMFNGATNFNQPISNWNTSRIGVMHAMFYNAKAFNQDIGNWHFYPYQSVQWEFLAQFFDGSGMDCVNYTKTILGWGEQNDLPKNVTFGAKDIKYTSQAKKARDYLITMKGWKFIGDTLSTGYCFSHNIPNGNTEVYPNPCNDKLFINYFNYASNLESWVNFKIIDINGNTIKTGVIESLGSNVFEIDTRELSSGNYILFMLDENIINISRTLFFKN